MQRDGTSSCKLNNGSNVHNRNNDEIMIEVLDLYRMFLGLKRKNHRRLKALKWKEKFYAILKLAKTK